MVRSFPTKKELRSNINYTQRKIVFSGQAGFHQLSPKYATFATIVYSCRDSHASD